MLTFLNTGNLQKKELFESACRGLDKYGVVTSNVASSPVGDYFACWGWRLAQRWRMLPRLRKNVLVFENGYLGERGSKWISLAWNGLNGRGEFFVPEEITGERFDKHFKLKPWKESGEHIVIMGQVRGDQSLMGKDLTRFYERVAKEAAETYNMPVYFKPHPVGLQRNANFRPKIEHIYGTMDEVLEKAHLVITYNSNSGVDAVINGVPAVSYDIGSMAYNVTSHDVKERIMPDREAWAHRLAWCQWTREEIANGDYWPYLSQLIIRNENASGKFTGTIPSLINCDNPNSNDIINISVDNPLL